MSDPRFPHLIDKNGQFDARKARQFLHEWARDNAVVNRTFHLSTHLGLSSEETYLAMACHLLAYAENFREMLIDEINTRIPTFGVQATQSGPFDTEQRSK